ncbi:MAG: Serine-rich adhesin, platelet-type [Candidatus Levybacteria bacterium GW2011_GWC1_40_19]|nr:MAG: Serine-rich adhesin, platelet-type [Candidatus Levybacteria bacterium GW2011_GWC1_40_19]
MNAKARGALQNFRHVHQRRGVYGEANFIRAGSKKILQATSALLFCVFLLSTFFLLPPTANAGTLLSVSDTISTSLPKTASMHKISFKNPTAVPASGKIIVRFPALLEGDTNTEASPSASTFQLNNLSSNVTLVKTVDDEADISSKTTVTTANPSTGTSPTITITLNSSTSIAANSVIEIFIGCKTLTSSKCSEAAPIVLNPTKTAPSGTSDRWLITLATQDSASIDIDTGKTRIATIESVKVSARIDPVLSFTIAGIEDALDVNTGNATGCTNQENTNSGTASSANMVNLGLLSTNKIKISAQLISIYTNTSSGYSLIASSSAPLTDIDTSHTIPSPKEPEELSIGNPGFGIHPCGLDVNEEIWGKGSTVKGDGAKYGWPSKEDTIVLASDPSGPVGSSVAAGNGLTSIEYAASIDSAVPAGLYRSVVTYIVTSTF